MMDVHVDEWIGLGSSEEVGEAKQPEVGSTLQRGWMWVDGETDG